MLGGEDPIFKIQINLEDLLQCYMVTNNSLAVAALNLFRVLYQRCPRLVKLRRPVHLPVLSYVVSEFIEPEQAPKLPDWALFDL